MPEQPIAPAPEEYRVYLEHVRTCRECGAVPQRCTLGEALYRTYRVKRKTC